MSSINFVSFNGGSIFSQSDNRVTQLLCGALRCNPGNGGGPDRLLFPSSGHFLHRIILHIQQPTLTELKSLLLGSGMDKPAGQTNTTWYRTLIYDYRALIYDLS